MPKTRRPLDSRSKQYAILYSDTFNTYPNPYKLTLQQYRIIIKTFAIVLVNRLILTGNLYQLPYRCGVLGITKRKLSPDKAYKYDAAKSKAYDTLVLHKNTHSDNYFVRYRWSKINAFLNIPTLIKKHYDFTSNRTSKRLLARAVIELNTIHNYYEHELLPR